MSGFFTSAFGAKKEGSSIYRDIFFKNPVGMCVVTHPDFEIKLVNERFSMLFGKKKSEISGELFASVWEKSDLRDEFFTILRRNGSVDNFRFSHVGCEKSGENIILSAEKIDGENFLICAVLCSYD